MNNTHYIVTIINDVISGACEITSTDKHPLLENQFHVKNEKIYQKIYNHMGDDVVSMKIDNETNTITSIKTSATPTVAVDLWKLLRTSRANWLKDSDWTQQPDVNLSNKAAWAAWRQSLRDIPADFPHIEDAKQALNNLISNRPSG